MTALEDAVARMHRQLEPLASLDEVLGKNKAFPQTIENLQRKAIRTANGPMENLRRAANYSALTQENGPLRVALDQLTTTTTVQRQFKEHQTYEKLLAYVHGNNASRRMTDGFEKHLRMLTGPIAEVKRNGLFAPDSDLRKSIATVTGAQSQNDKMFRLPEVSEVSKLIEGATQVSDLTHAFVADATGLHALQAVMKNMTQPWLHINHAHQSAIAFSELVALSNSVSHLPPFGPPLVNILRSRLGDWRDPINLDVDAIIKPSTRLDLYGKQGLDPTLTDFTNPAFHECTILSGLEISVDTSDAAKNDDVEELSFVQAEEAFSHLRSFEVTVRAFIVEIMEYTFGEHWMKQQLPKDMRDKWADKQQADIEAGRLGQPLIEYADFSDYKMIIERGDNWKHAFKSIFRRKEDVRESFQRLNPVRIATMHSRIVMPEDYLLLKVETSRVIKAIKSRSR